MTLHHPDPELRRWLDAALRVFVAVRGCVHLQRCATEDALECDACGVRVTGEELLAEARRLRERHYRCAVS